MGCWVACEFEQGKADDIRRRVMSGEEDSPGCPSDDAVDRPE